MKNSRLIFSGLAGGLLLLIVLAALLGANSRADASPGSLEAQRAALRTEYQSELKDLQSAPRYSLTAAVDPASGRFSGEVSVAYTNTSAQPVAELVFRLYPNAGSIYGGGHLAVERAQQGSAGLRPVLSPDGTTLYVPLAQALKPGQAATVQLMFSGQAPAGAGRGYGIFGRPPGAMTLAGWYPVLAPYADGWQAPAVPRVGDALQAETSFYSVDLALPAGYQLASSGSLVSTQTVTATLPALDRLLAGAGAPAASIQAAAPGSTASPVPGTPAPGHASPTPGGPAWVLWRLASGPAREFSAAVSRDFELSEARSGDISLRLFSLPDSPANTSPQAGLEIAAHVLQAYEELYGPYPFKELDIVEPDIAIDGYEFSGIVFIDAGLRTRGSRADYEYILAHEIAHQWWYGLAGNRTVNEPWLDEAHATYSAVLYLEKAGRPASGARLVSNWTEVAGRLPPATPVDSSALEFTNWGLYRDTVYLRGALFIHALRQELGEAAFQTLLQQYQARQRYRIATTADYLNLAEELAGRELDSFTNAWFK